MGCVLGGLSFFYFADSSRFGDSNQPGQQSLPPEIKTSLWPEKLSRQDISDYLNKRTNTSVEDIGQFALEKNGIRFRIETTIDTDLQKYIDRLLRHSRTLQAAVVVLDPYDGRILAMTSRDTNGNGDNLCLKAEFPAASLFKIISTAAVLEKAGYSTDRSLFYEGSKHTLYKYQLRESQGPHSARTNLRKAFATSNNSVFGKIGIYALGQEVIDEYAEKIAYRAPRGVLISPINRKTAEDLKFLMKYAARYGTTRSAFRELRRKRSLADLNLGAKTGTINDRLDRFKYDWITAFALTSGGSRGICIGVLAVHGKKLGTRSTELVRAIINFYFGS
jgi:cell division protein FtsI/penicillin-binding protein 2